MFAKLAATVIVALSAFSVSAAPVAESTDLAVRYGSDHSFDNYGGISSFNGFDNFYGSDNFDNSHFSESSITVVKETEVVCHSESIEIIQQRLLVLQEMAKRIITEQICEVETQTVVFEQFYSSLHGFSRDLRHDSHRDVGYDSGISSHFSNFYNSDGSLSNDDWGFSGSNLGSSYVVPSGSNWGDNSFVSVGNAYKAARSAVSKF
jgi:hypothetical protein